MSNYFRNLKLWYLGFGWFGQLTFREQGFFFSTTVAA
jgi:hypothetical protein